MTVRACTIVARNYLPYARVLADSFLEHHPAGQLTVLLVDDVDREVDPGQERFAIMHLDEVVEDTPELHRLAMIYDVTELSTAVKPLFLRHLLAEGLPHILYLDPDIEVFAPLDDVARLSEAHSIVLVPHTTKPMPRDGLKPTEADILASGVYNLGFLGLGPECGEFLDWWWERLRWDAVIDHQAMLFTDQRWVDFLPGYFRHHILRDPTLNVAYWNVYARELIWAGTRYELEGRPLRFFHYSGFDPEHPYLLSKHQGDQPRLLLSEQPALARLCLRYSERLRAAGFRSGTADRGYRYDRLPTGMRVDRAMRRLYRDEARSAERVGVPPPPCPFDPVETDAFVAWLREPVDIAGRREVTRYLAALWREHPDLQVDFPALGGTDAKRFVSWAISDAAAGLVPEQLLPPSPALSVVDEPPLFRTTNLQPGVNVVGYFRAELGVGEGARLLVATLEAAGIPYSTFSYGKYTRSRQEHRFEERGPRDAPYDVNIVCVNADLIEGFVHDTDASFFANRYTIGMWAWEVEDFPARLDRGFRVVDEVWAVSAHAAKAISHRAPKPVYCLPHAIVSPAVPAGIGRRELGLPDGFLFLFVFDFFSVLERKNPGAVIEAFSRAFASGEGPTLVIKCINGSHRLADLERLRFLVSGRPDIVLIDDYLDTAANAALMASCDCYVSLHRAEGFGLTLAEAMALEKPVIATGYSGNLEFMNEDNSFLVDCRLVPIPPGCDPYPESSVWAEPDLDQAAALMRRVLEEPELAAQKAAKGAIDLRERHSPVARAAFIHERLAAIRGRSPSAEPPAFSAEQSRPTPQLSRLAEQLATPPGAEPSSLGPLRRLVRRAAIRAIRPYWWRQRELDEAIFEALSETVAVTGTHAAALDAAVREFRAELDELRLSLTAEERARMVQTELVETPLEQVEEKLARPVAELDGPARADVPPRAGRSEPSGPPSLLGRVDAPADGATVPRGPLEIQGWALGASTTVARVEIGLEDRVVEPAWLGFERRDVERWVDLPGAAISGFSAWLDLSGLPEALDKAEITATAVGIDGKRSLLGRIKIRIGPPRLQPSCHEQRSSANRALDGSQRPTAGGALRLLAFSHDLAYAGAQLALLDELRDLRRRAGISCTVVAPGDGPLRGDLEKAGIAVHRTSLWPVDDPGAYEAKVMEIASWAALEGFDAVLASTLVSFPGIDMAQRLGLPSIWSIHESSTLPTFLARWYGETPIHPKVERRAYDAFGWASRLVFVAEAGRLPFAGLYDPERSVVSPISIDVDAVDEFLADFDGPAARAARGIPEHASVVLCAGSIEPRKGQASLAHALGLVARDHPAVVGVLLGARTDPYTEAVRRALADLGLESRIRFVPFTREVLPWLGLADILACPSANETLPVAVLQAMAVGTPVVASAVSGVPEVIVDGRTGYLCEPCDVSSLAAALERALTASAEERDRVVRGARQLMRERHGAGRRADQLWELLAGLTAVQVEPARARS